MRSNQDRANYPNLLILFPWDWYKSGEEIEKGMLGCLRKMGLIRIMFVLRLSKKLMLCKRIVGKIASLVFEKIGE